ncbi:C40 family peptidase [Georgenia sp. 311]|uniref:C40 family peptidase n=1 Tax=Georgenia sp. 311 TaxID=2585134 RepID=UPI0021001A7D|nr:C40 family peptidase [Georgenia sp. 311]
MSIAAVQSRMAEIQSALTAVTEPPAAAAAATQRGADFGGALATALATAQPGLGGATPATPGVGDSLASVLGLQTGAGALASPLAGLTGAPGAGTAQSPAAGTGAALVESASKYLGVPYVWGGETLSEGGLDCSGLVQLAMKDIGVDVPRVARDQMRIGTEVPSLAQALPGDLVVTRGGGHIGIYAGDNKWIHAPYPGEQVKLAELTTTPTTIRRVLPAGA